METGFVNKEIVWAKVKGYPWWPAEVTLHSHRLPNYLRLITMFLRLFSSLKTHSITLFIKCFS